MIWADSALRALGGRKMLARCDWLYDEANKGGAAECPCFCRGGGVEPPVGAAVVIAIFMGALALPVGVGAAQGAGAAMVPRRCDRLGIKNESTPET